MEQMDMRDEKKPFRKKLIPEGWRIIIINSCDEGKSKAGNAQYVIGIQDIKLGYEDMIYAVSEPKKRWFLKTILDACGVECIEGIYNFTPPLSKTLVGKTIMAFFEHEPNSYINREGVEVTTTQHRIVEVKEFVVEKVVQKGWDDDLK